MKKRHISLFIISIFAFSVFGIAQTEVKKDTLLKKKSYGLRLGIDLSNPIRTVLNTNRKSIELVVDYRIKKNWYIATEVGFLNRFEQESHYDFTTKGQYIKLGVNYNTYKNWLHMDNEIYVGFRYGFSLFSYEVSNITVESEAVLPFYTNETQNYIDLRASWFAFVAGFKVQVYPNIYLGTQFNLNKMLFQKGNDSFKNLYVPGFNRVYLNKGGFGFNYTISYRIPIKKK